MLLLCHITERVNILYDITDRWTHPGHPADLSQVPAMPHRHGYRRCNCLHAKLLGNEVTQTTTSSLLMLVSAGLTAALGRGNRADDPAKRSSADQEAFPPSQPRRGKSWKATFSRHKGVPPSRGQRSSMHVWENDCGHLMKV